MAQEIDERNRASLDQLRAVAIGLSDEEFLHPIDPPWTAAALFAHVAFWDRFVHARWRHAVETGTTVPVPIDDAPMEMINQAALREWAVIPPRIAAEECLTAAQTIDHFIEHLEVDAISQVVREGRERLVDRSLHRREHLDTIERAFPNR
jgi:hypothetical protein